MQGRNNQGHDLPDFFCRAGGSNCDSHNQEMRSLIEGIFGDLGNFYRVLGGNVVNVPVNQVNPQTAADLTNLINNLYQEVHAIAPQYINTDNPIEEIMRFNFRCNEDSQHATRVIKSLVFFALSALLPSNNEVMNNLRNIDQITHQNIDNAFRSRGDFAHYLQESARAITDILTVNQNVGNQPIANTTISEERETAEQILNIALDTFFDHSAHFHQDHHYM